jgi:LPS-assembly protein
VAHRFQTGTQKTTDAIFMQLELSGLAGLGTNPLNVLKQNIGGFTQSKPQAADINLDEF